MCGRSRARAITHIQSTGHKSLLQTLSRVQGLFREFRAPHHCNPLHPIKFISKTDVCIHNFIYTDFFCFAATQLASQLRKERTQVVWEWGIFFSCSNSQSFHLHSGGVSHFATQAIPCRGLFYMFIMHGL